MDLIRYVEELRRHLLGAAEAGGEDARALAERLMLPLESATRLALLDALSDAANEITRDLAPGSVELRLRGRDPEFVVTSPTPDVPLDDVIEREPRAPASSSRPPAVEADEAATARITLRLPEPLKQRIERAAAADGLSVNAWLGRAVLDALGPDAGDHRSPRRSAPRGPSGGDRFTGWAR